MEVFIRYDYVGLFDLKVFFMKFTRVNKDTVNCIITEDDMDEQGLKLEDLFQKSKEAMDFLHDVMEKAVEEVDYKPAGDFTPMQITVLPDHSISLTLSENLGGAFADMLKNITEKAGLKLPKNFLEELGDIPEEDRIPKLSEYLQNLKEFTNSVRDMAMKVNGDMDDQVVDQIPVKKADNNRKTKIESEGTGEEVSELDRLKFQSFVFRFDSLRTVVALSKQIPESVGMFSALYKNPKTGRFYMLFDKKDEKAKTFASVFSICYEYGAFVTTKDMMILHMDENYECVLKENAVENLKAL